MLKSNSENKQVSSADVSLAPAYDISETKLTNVDHKTLNSGSICSITRGYEYIKICKQSTMQCTNIVKNGLSDEKSQ